MQKDYQNAIVNYSKAIEINDKFPDAFSNRGLSYYRMEKLDEALKDLNKAIEIKPDHEKAFYNRALLFEKKKDYKKAVEDHGAVLKLNPENHDAASSRRDIFNETGFYQKAASSKIEGNGATKSIKTIVMPEAIFKSAYHHDRIDSLSDFLGETAKLKIPVKNLPSNVLEAFYVEYYYQQVTNGGLRQFVYNSRWDDSKNEKIRSGLQNMGATKHLAVFDKLTAIVDSFGKRLTPLLNREFSDYLVVMKPKLEALNDEFYKVDEAESIEELNYQYIGNFKNLELSTQY
jgi:tetratricopeptide (TPR) repeat protein